MSSLTVDNHDRNLAGLNYVYPVLSRRAGGLSIGINLNTNNACNWRCIYCQVPDLKKGAAPEVDLSLLARELRTFLADVQHGDFFERFAVSPEHQVIKDIAISGNGEPTSAKNFAETITLIGAIANELKIFPMSRFVLITNGSLIHQAAVQEGLKRLNNFGGEVWYKLDSATKAGRLFINNTVQHVNVGINNLLLSATLCNTKIQMCVFAYRGVPMISDEKNALLEILKTIKSTSAVDHVLLYTLARPSTQPEAHDLASLTVDQLEEFAAEIRHLGFSVSVSY